MFWPSFLISPSKSSANTDLDVPELDPSEPYCIRLDELQLGQCGMVCGLDLSESDSNRLKTLGICPGRRVWLVRHGDPMILRVMDAKVGLGDSLARQVTVEICPPLSPQDQKPLPIRVEREPGEPGT